MSVLPSFILPYSIHNDLPMGTIMVLHKKVAMPVVYMILWYLYYPKPIIPRGILMGIIHFEQLFQLVPYATRTKIETTIDQFIDFEHEGLEPLNSMVYIRGLMLMTRIDPLRPRYFWDVHQKTRCGYPIGRVTVGPGATKPPSRIEWACLILLLLSFLVAGFRIISTGQADESVVVPFFIFLFYSIYLVSSST